MRLAYDLKLKKVGCVLLQAALGGEPALASQLPAEDWLLAPTPDLKVYEISEEQFKQLLKMHRSVGAM